MGEKITQFASIGALIDLDGRVLITKRPSDKIMPGFWEFPGGKIKKNESPENALIRELKEELGLNISSQCIAPIGFSSHSYEEFNVVLLLYACRGWNETVKPIEVVDMKWVNSNELRSYKMPKANKSLISFIQDII